MSVAKRRTNAEVRILILEAAKELFDAQGFVSTTTKQIAERAGVQEPLVFRNFGSKANLFDEAVVAPFAGLIDTYVEGWERPESRTEREALIGEFLEGLYDLARKHRRLLLDAVAQRQLGVSPSDDVLDHIARAVHRIVAIPTIGEDYPAMDPAAAVSSVMGMIFGAALLDDLFYARGTRRPSRRRIVNELTGTILRGITRDLPD